MLCICSCGYFSSFRDTTTKHARTRHRDNREALYQSNESNWVSLRAHVAGLPDVMSVLPVKSNNPTQDCCPDRNKASALRRRSPLKREVPAAAVARIDQQEPGVTRVSQVLEGADPPLPPQMERRLVGEPLSSGSPQCGQTSPHWKLHCLTCAVLSKTIINQ